jgi:FMN-dependent oxidoreductase (nitrilotriacetate monooxygenase family)
MHLALDFSWTLVETDWRQPTSWVNRTYPDIGLFEDLARIAERGLFDLIFFGDGAGIPNVWQGSIEAAVRRGVAWPRMEMSPWITAMARVTSHIGFGLTYASTFMHPYYVARLLNSLDHITNGRIAFNVITSQRRSDFENYGFDDLVEHGQRYDRMEEFIDVCKKLWASVEQDAFVWDARTGVVANPDKVKAINHVGRFFKVKGPLSVPPSPQGRPVLIQAGGSQRGIQAAAKFVDHVFGAGKGIKLMAEQRAHMDAALIKEGRDPQEVGILWSTKVIVAETEAESQLTSHPRQWASGSRTTPASTWRRCRHDFRSGNSISASSPPTHRLSVLSACLPASTARTPNSPATSSSGMGWRPPPAMPARGRERRCRRPTTWRKCLRAPAAVAASC